MSFKIKFKIRTISQNRNLNLNFKIRTISQNSIIKFKMNIKKKIIIKSYIMKFIIIIMLSCFTSYTDFFQSHEAHISDT